MLDSIEYKNDKKKSDGYSFKKGKKSIDTFELEVMNGRPTKKKLTKKRVHTNSFNGSRMVLDGTLYETAIPCLEFSIEFQSNKLIYQKEYTKRQQIVYVLIKYLHDKKGFGYRKISQWLNKSGIKTHRGKKWFNSSVISVLKRKHERDVRNEQIRNQYFPFKISKLEVS